MMMIMMMMMMTMMMNVFVVWLTEERRLALFQDGKSVRDPHHRETLTRRKQDLNLCRTSSGFIEGNCAVVITTTPRRHSDKGTKLI